MQVNTPITVPVLETERLWLRSFVPDDLDAYLIMASDPEVVRYIAQGQPLNRDLAWQSLAYLLGHWQMKGYGLWAVEDKASGELVGRVGLYDPPGWPGMEIGWMVARSRWRQGIAFEAAQRVLDWSSTQPDKQQLISLIHPENKASIKLARKLGAHFVEMISIGELKALEFAFDLQKSSGTLNAK